MFSATVLPKMDVGDRLPMIAAEPSRSTFPSCSSTKPLLLVAGVATAVGGAYLFHRLTANRSRYPSCERHTTPLPKGGPTPSASPHKVDDDGLFVTAGGPRLFSTKASSPERSANQSYSCGVATIRSAALGDTVFGRQGPVPTEQEVWTSGIVAREKALHMVRALLTKVEGVVYEDSDGEPTDSDTTNVSLNYAIATEIEGQTRDEVMDAYAVYMQALADKHHVPGEGEEDLEMTGIFLAKMAEYLDISNEREKLRIRRETQRFTEDAKMRSVMRSNAGEEDSLGVGMESLLRPPQEAPIDRRLASDLRDRENFEVDWGDEVSEEEEEYDAAFMEYLEQDDSKRRFLSRSEIYERRQERARGEIRFVTENGMELEDVLAEMEPEPDDVMLDDEDELFIQDVYEDMEEEEEGGFSVEHDIWTDEEKGEFETKLIEKVYELAAMWGVTAAMGEREALRQEEARVRRHATNAGEKGVAPNAEHQPSEGEDEWEDVE